MKIPQAMAWKYGAKCSKTKDGQYIDVWEHPTEPKPSKDQVAIDIAEYKTYISSGQRVSEEKDKKFNQDTIKAIGLTMKDFMNEVIGGRNNPITNNELKTKFKSYL